MSGAAVLWRQPIVGLASSGELGGDHGSDENLRKTKNAWLHIPLAQPAGSRRRSG